MKITDNKKVVAAVITTTIIITGIFINGSADGTTPGSEADPVVTQSYVEAKSEQTKYYIDSLIAKSNQEIASLKTQLEQKNQEIAKLQETVGQLSSGGSGGGEGFQVIMLNKDKTMLTGVGTELILRSGKASAVKGTAGGLSNVTSAKDLNTGDNVALNNLIMSPRNDGRGIKAAVDSYVMVKGAYTIK